jgi:hypothetical protein
MRIRCDDRHSRCFHRPVVSVLQRLLIAREETAMSVHHPKYADRRARTPVDQDRKPAARTISSDLRSKNTRWPRSILPVIDDAELTIFLVMIIMVLSVLNVMLRFPELGAVIAQYNQF